MGFFDSFFDSLFDSNGNATTDISKQLLGMAILEDINAEDDDFDLEDDF